MKIDFKNWNLGGKIIFVASCVAASSFFLPWIDIGIASRNGFSQGMFLLSGLFVYPVLKLLNNMSMSKKVGIACGVISILSGIIYINYNTEKVFNKLINVSGSGVYVFLLASVALIIGVILYKAFPVPKHRDNNSAGGSEMKGTIGQLVDKVQKNVLTFLVSKSTKNLIEKHRDNDESLRHLFEKALNSLEQREEVEEKLVTLVIENRKMKSYILKIRKKAQEAKEAKAK